MNIFPPFKLGTVHAMRLFVQQQKEGKIDDRVTNELAEVFASFLQEFDETDFSERGAYKKSQLLKKHFLGEDGNRGRRTNVNPSVIQAELVEALYETGCIEEAKKIVHKKNPHYKKPVNDAINTSIDFSMRMLYQKQTQDIALKVPDDELKEVRRVYPEYLQVEIDGGYTFSSTLSEALRSHKPEGKNTLLQHFEHFLSKK